MQDWNSNDSKTSFAIVEESPHISLQRAFLVRHVVGTEPITKRANKEDSMANIFILGATGLLGRHILRQSVNAGHRVTALVRTTAPFNTVPGTDLTVLHGDLFDLSDDQLLKHFEHQDAVIQTAGNVGLGQRFVDIVDRIVSVLEKLPESSRPVSWFLAGMGLLDVDDQGRKAIDLEPIREMYWPHLVNYERIRRSGLDWRILCPGPMVDSAERTDTMVRYTIDKMPFDLPDGMSRLQEPALIQALSRRMRETVLSYQEAASLILANIHQGGDMSRRRIGLARTAEERSE